MKLLLPILMLLASANAFATGGTTCTVDNDEIKLDVNLTNGRYFGSPLVALSTVELEIKQSTILVGLTKYTFTQNDIPYWFNLNNEMKLGAYVEPTTDPDGNPLDFYASLAVIIDAKYSDSDDGGPGSYVGTYEVIQTSNSVGPGSLKKKYQGFIKCELE